MDNDLTDLITVEELCEGKHTSCLLQNI